MYTIQVNVQVQYTYLNYPFYQYNLVLIRHTACIAGLRVFTMEVHINLRKHKHIHVHIKHVTTIYYYK